MEKLTDSINQEYNKIVPERLAKKKINSYYRLAIHFKLPDKEEGLNEFIVENHYCYL